MSKKLTRGELRDHIQKLLKDNGCAMSVSVVDRNGLNITDAVAQQLGYSIRVSIEDDPQSIPVVGEQTSSTS